MDLKNPHGLSNKIGTPMFHEHDDDRIHIEGTVMEMKNIDLGSYFKVTDGKLANGHLIYPGQDKTYNVRNGDTCNGQEGKLSVYINGERKENYEDYNIYPDPYVPPGDCIIIKFGPDTSETTDKICNSWKTKGWNYDNYKQKREDRTEAGETWQ